MERDDALDVIGDERLEVIATLIRDAWLWYHEGLQDGALFRDPQPVTSRTVVCPRSRANTLSDYMRELALSRLALCSGVRFEARGPGDPAHLFHIDNLITLRFKKVDVAGIAQNHRTQQVVALLNNMEPQPQLPGMPPRACTLNAGYVTDEDNVNIDDIVLSYPLGRNQTAWVVSLLDRIAQVAPVVTLPGSATIQQATPTRQRVRLRPASDANEAANTDEEGGSA